MRALRHAPSTRRRAAIGVLAMISALALAACGEDEAGSQAGAQPVEPEKLAKGLDLPKPLAANLEQANELVDGGSATLTAKLDELNGHPVVVNQWGSWCPPCRAEFPFFAQSAEAHLEEVAFLGVDIQDNRDSAEEFLAELPVPYPSVFDPDTEAVTSLGWTGSSPTTWFVDGKGEIVFQRPGAYANRAQLEADIERYLLSS